MRSVQVPVLLVTILGCGVSSPTGVQESSNAQTAASVCELPSTAARPNCTASYGAGSCEVPDDGGAPSCAFLCGPSKYVVDCRAPGIFSFDDPSLTPPPAWGCSILALPTPSNAGFFCCPCG